MALIPKESWIPKESVIDLRAALSCFDRARSEALVERFIAHVHHSPEPVATGEGKQVLRLLRRKRKFELLTAAADALLERDAADFATWLAYAQALLDRGLLAGARPFLQQLVRDSDAAMRGADVDHGADTNTDTSEARVLARRANLEARGLLGRLHKQWYVNAGAPNIAQHAGALRRSIECYWQVYDEDRSDPDRRWHAINAVALGLRARRDGLRLELGFSPEQLAAELAQAVRADAASLWDYAIGMEASLALGAHREALGWAQRYVGEPEVDAFELASSHRQLVEVWQLDARAQPGAQLLPLLEARMLGLDDGRVILDPATHDVRALCEQGFERVIDGGFVPLQSYLLGLERAQAVARLGVSHQHGEGTGFLVRGGDLLPTWGDEPLLLTNAHVLARDGSSWQYGLMPSETRVTFSFSGQDHAAPFVTGVREVLWQSHVEELDVCVARLCDAPAHVSSCPLRPKPLPPPLDEQRVFIIGHPGGEGLKFSLYSNRVSAQNQRYIHYQAATDHGSSGSPVFDSDWRVVALHHRGSSALPRLDGPGFRETNEGTLISAIVAAIRGELS